MLPIGRTVVMKYPDVTRAISFEISGRRTTDRWLSALYRQRVRSTEASCSGNRSARSASLGWRIVPDEKPRLGFRKIGDVERETHSRKAGKISGRQPGPVYLRLCDVESARGNAAESERICVYDQPA